MIKKILFSGLAAVALTSCLNTDSPKLSVGLTENLHILAPNGSVSIDKTTINVVIEQGDNLSQLLIGDLKLGDKTVTINTAPTKAESYNIPGLGSAYIWRPTALAGSTLSFSDGYAIYSTKLDVYPTPVPGILTASISSFVSAGFIVDGYTVKTFADQSYFTGTFEALMPGATTAFTTKAPYLGLNLNIAQNKATIVIYEAQFAQQMPKINMLIENLDITWTAGGYTVSGTNVIPQQIEGSNKTPAPGYTMKSVSFINTSKDLSKGSLQFELTNGAKCTFTGSNMPANIQ